MKSLLLLVVAVSAAAVACGTTSSSSSAGGAVVRDGSAIVVRGSDLSGAVLDGLRARVPGMSVTTENSRCPIITLRGQRSARNQGNPAIYVDGAMMTDTCILQQINTTDVERVVIYPNGQAAETGVQHHPFGIIMVYRIQR